MTSLAPLVAASPLAGAAPASRWGGLIDRGLVLAVFLAGGCAMSLNVADPDLWGHIQYGRDCLQHGLPHATTYSYIAVGYPWVNHEILTELATALVNDTLGGVGLMVGKALLGLVVTGVIFAFARRQGAGLFASCLLTLLVAVTLGNHWSLRPQLASYVSFALELALLGYCFSGWEGGWRLDIAGREPEPITYSSPRMRWLWLMPVLIALWTNAHGGFLAGLCVYIAYLSLRGLEIFTQRGWESAGLLRRFGLMLAVAGLATLLNPYGPEFHRWLWDDLKVPRPEIVEWRAPDFFDAQTVPFLLLGCVWLACLCFSRKRRDFTHEVILALVLWQSLTHLRHIAFFAIACGFWLPRHLESVLQRFKITSDSASFGAGLSPRLQPWFAAAVALACLISGGQLANRLTTLKVEHENFPVGAVNYIAQQGLSGRAVVTFNWAQYALAAVGAKSEQEPGILVHVDGRCRTSYSQAMLDEHFDFILGPPSPDQRYRDPGSGPYQPAKVLEHRGPDLVLISRLQEPSAEVMKTQTERWTLLYQDGLAQLWGRGTRFNDPQSPDYLPPSARSISDSPVVGSSPWPAIPVRQTKPRPELAFQQN